MVVTNNFPTADVNNGTVEINEKLSLGVSAKQWKPTRVIP